MKRERQIRLFRLGRNQIVRIPREFELFGDRAIIRRDGSRLIIEPVTQQSSLFEYLATAEPMDFPEIKDLPP